MAERYDLVVIGGGAAGLVASLVAAEVGARVALIERAEQPGGDCVFSGCVPSKTLLATAKLAHQIRTADRLGLKPTEPQFEFAEVTGRIEQAIAAAGERDRSERLRARGIEVIRGHGRFERPGLVSVDGRGLRYRVAVIATGSRPTLPGLPGLTEVEPLTNETVFKLREQPKRLAILGGGAVGVELGQAFARLGTQVTIVEAADRLLPREEAEAGELIARTLREEGVELRLAAKATRVDPAGIGLGDRQGDGYVPFDRLLVAVGREPVTEGLGLESVGVELSPSGAIHVDATLKTTGDRIYAAGDVLGEPMFTHVAGYHGLLAAANGLFRTRRKVDHSAVPRVVFTDPELAAVGMTEGEAAERLGEPPLVFRHDYRDSDRAITSGEARGFAKLVTSRKGKLLGATIVAPAAGESVAEVARLIRDGRRVGDLSRIVHAYPTFTEGPARAADGWWSYRLGGRGKRGVLRGLLALLRMLDRPHAEPSPRNKGSNAA
jgi:pyruvate/2-oxoglutarate dehydrogenase complex dihydrolipoamide dehydrogenase (E3) component